MIRRRFSIHDDYYPFVYEIKLKEPHLSDILLKANNKITSVIGEDKTYGEDEIDEEWGSSQQDFDRYFCAIVYFDDHDLQLGLAVNMIFEKEIKSYNEDFNGSNMISECDIQCFFRVPEQKHHKWFDIFKNHENFYLSEDKSDIGLHRRLVSFKKELEAFLDGQSSRTPLEIKKIFKDFLEAEPFGFPNNLESELECILNEFLTCIKNYERC